MAPLLEKTVWRLKSGHDRRFRQGHPWVYSNELQESPKGLPPGAPVELQDAGGRFLARGYGNPHSLIAFRAVSRDPDELNPLSAENLALRLISAGKLRIALGLGDFSHRWIYGEADGLPGLVVDRYVCGSGQVLVIQAHTAGIDLLLPILPEALDRAGRALGREGLPTAIVLRNDLAVRKLEGLKEEEPRLLREAPGLNASTLKKIEIQIRASGAEFNSDPKPVLFTVDLLEGQKTGFFLDQSGNIELAVSRLAGFASRTGQKAIRILDLCTYVGQWTTQIGRAMKARGIACDVLLVDASASALELARINAERVGARCETLKADVLHGLEGLESESFDLVICDPPALIKGRKDTPQGRHAYLQLNTQAFRLVKPEGAVVSCSCSALLEEEELLQILSKAAYRNRCEVRWVGRGAPSPDHPMRAEFPEGRYLKAWVGLVTKK